MQITWHRQSNTPTKISQVIASTQTLDHGLLNAIFLTFSRETDLVAPSRINFNASKPSCSHVLEYLALPNNGTSLDEGASNMIQDSSVLAENMSPRQADMPVYSLTEDFDRLEAKARNVK